MKSVPFTVLVKLLKPIIWILAIWLLLRGHNAPGGGFIAGLVASSAGILQILSQGWHSLPEKHRDNLFVFMGLGLSTSLMSGLFSVYIDNPFLTGRWITIAGTKIGTPILFDLGVFFVVYSVALICAGHILHEEEEEQKESR